MNYKTTTLQYGLLPQPQQPNEKTVQKFRIYCDCDKLKSVINLETLLDAKPLFSPPVCNKCNKQPEIHPIMFPISQLKMTTNSSHLAKMENEEIK